MVRGWAEVDGPRPTWAEVDDIHLNGINKDFSRMTPTKFHMDYGLDLFHGSESEPIRIQGASDPVFQPIRTIVTHYL